MTTFLRAPDLKKVRWCIFYDLVLRIQQTPGLNVDLSRGMDFDQPQYLKIDDRPVLYIWETWNAIGNYTGAFQEAREKAALRGFDVYIVGDIIRTDHFYPKLAAAYDANTSFLFFVPGSPHTRDVGEAAVDFDETMTKWENLIAGMKVTGREDEVILQPGFAPQFDNRQFTEVNGGGASIYIPALSRDQVAAMAEVVRAHAHAAGNEGLKLIWLNTWNNWPETTTFEPTVSQDPKYPAGNYGFDLVEVIREVFGAKTFSN